jgi:hypothetical protein
VLLASQAIAMDRAIDMRKCLPIGKLVVYHSCYQVLSIGFTITPVRITFTCGILG